MARRKTVKNANVSFNDQLILFRYFLSLFDKTTLHGLAGRLNDSSYEGLNEDQNTYFYEELRRICLTGGDKVKVNPDKLRQYDENICRYVKQIGQRRGGLKLKYYQYIALLFTEIYLDRYFSDPIGLASDINTFIDDEAVRTMGGICFSHVKTSDLNKLAFMCATGSGKTLLMHINILQFSYYLRRAQRRDSRIQINKIIVLAPNEGMSQQHLQELYQSSIPASIFQKERSLYDNKDDVVIIDMNKLKEEGKVKTVSIDSFEQNNLVLVDEAHRGLAGDVWYDYRERLSADGGFAFEYSATFKQALRGLQLPKNQALLEEYCKAILMDYSYKYFYEDGYGKEYRIYNLHSGIDDEQRYLYLTGCLLSFYQQMKLFQMHKEEYAPFQIEKPLLVFVGNRVTKATRTDKSRIAELSDVEEVLDFLNNFVGKKDTSLRRIQAVLDEDTGLMDGEGNELFAQNFNEIRAVFKGTTKAEDIYRDILRIVFNSHTDAEVHRLHLENLRQVPGEIALRIGDTGDYFGVISIGDPATLIKQCDKRGIVTKTEEFLSDSLFQKINKKDSAINLLIGSRKFTEGWNSWRVSTMGLINFAKGEGSQAIQLFGRGVRLHGYGGCLKRSSHIKESVKFPRGLGILETLTIFGVKAQYMEEFRKYLELEDLPANENIIEFRMPVWKRNDILKDTPLQVIKLREGADFKKQAKRLILDVPDEGFLRYLRKNPVVIDCRSKVQTIKSNFSLEIQSATEEHTLPVKYLPYLDYDYIFEELEQYKNEKLYYNLILTREKLQDILATQGWYGWIIPQARLVIDSMDKLEQASDFCVMVLKGYMDRFYKYEKEKWEAPRMEYQTMRTNDRNLVNEYTITYTQSMENDQGAEILEALVDEVSTLLNTKQRIPQYEISQFSGNFTMFDFEQHLYAPLISMKGKGLNISVSPVSLNGDEKYFVDLLKRYVETKPGLLEGKKIFLLRNKSKTGMGFFEAGNFYPDYILWIDTPDIQYVTFIDPKGLVHVRENDPKIEFYRTIKELEKRLQPSANKRILLNSFIFSVTNALELDYLWGMEKAERERRHVLCLHDDDCIAVMMEMILAN